MSSHSKLASVNFAAFVLIGLVICLIVLVRIGIQALFFGEKKKRKERKNAPPCVSDPALGVEHHFATLEDVTLHYVSAGNPKNQLIVFLHGFPDFWFTWQKQIIEFKKDFWVVAPDMRGYGLSSKPEKVSDYKMSLLVQDVKSFLEKIGGGRPAVLVGHDWGGVVAWALTAAHPDLVHRLVVVNAPHPDVMGCVLRSSFDQMRRSWYVVAFQFPKLTDFLMTRNDFESLDIGLKGYGAEEIEAVKYTFSQPGVLRSATNYYRAAEDGGPVAPGYIMVPTLIVWGEQDPHLGVRLAHLSIQRALGRLELVPSAGHWPHRECASKVNDHIRCFLQSSDS